MDFQTATGDDRWLRRYIALLMSFAEIAGEAAGRSEPVRLLVLWILRRADTVMTDIVFEISGEPPCVMQFAGGGSEPEDAMRLAERFLMLAETLVALLAMGIAAGDSLLPCRRRALLLQASRGRQKANCPHLLACTPIPNDTS